MSIPQRTAKRIYSPSALEWWFQKLNCNWESFFSSEALKRGREIYRSGVIREVELSAEDAIIHCRMGKEGYYSMVEWDNGTPRIRGSVEAREFNESVAAAGMYEIEELVADEVNALTPDSSDKVEPEEEKPEPDGEKGEFSGGGEKGRKIEIFLMGKEKGLLMKPCWKAENGHYSPAFKQKDENGKAEGEQNRRERESLIRLTGLARRAGFQYRPDRGDFFMRKTPEIALFLTDALENWKRFFPVVLDDEVRIWKRGVQKVKITGNASRAGRKNSMTIEWNLWSGDRKLSREQSLRLAKRGGGLSLVPGVGLLEVSEEQAEALEEWQVFHGREEVGEWPRYMLFSLFAESMPGLSLVDELKDWKKSLKKAGEKQWKIRKFFRNYQARGVEWLAGQCELGCHTLLADEMGLGKTLQVLGLIHARPLRGKLGSRPHLIVCPASVVPVWKNEIERFFPDFEAEILKTGHDFQSFRKENLIWLVSYTQLRRHRHLLGDVKFGYSVLDEAQQIKNPDAKVSQACMQINAAHRIALTGTPLENRHLDLWSLFRYLMPGLLGSRRVYERHLNDENREDFTHRLKEQVSPFILRRVKSEVMKELPPKVEMDLICPLTDLQEKLYRKLTGEGIQSMGEDLETAMNSDSMSFFTLLTRLRQVCCDPGLLPGQRCDISNSGKIISLLDKVGEILESGGKIVVFSQFTSLLARVRQAMELRFQDMPLFELTGKTRDRDRPVREFQETNGGGIILVSLRAGGLGITLHASDYVFLLDPWWNPAVEAQAIDRVHRIGQENPVFVYRMITRGTVEERIQKLKVEKKAMFDQLVGDMEGFSKIKDSFRNLSGMISLQLNDVPLREGNVSRAKDN